MAEVKQNAPPAAAAAMFASAAGRHYMANMISVAKELERKKHEVGDALTNVNLDLIHWSQRDEDLRDFDEEGRKRIDAHADKLKSRLDELDKLVAIWNREVGPGTPWGLLGGSEALLAKPDQYSELTDQSKQAFRMFDEDKRIPHETRAKFSDINKRLHSLVHGVQQLTVLHAVTPAKGTQKSAKSGVGSFETMVQSDIADPKNLMSMLFEYAGFVPTKSRLATDEG